MITEKIVIPLLKALITGVLVALFAASWFIPNPGWKLFAATLSGVCLASWLAVVLPKRFDHLTSASVDTKVYPTTTRIEITASDPAGQFSAGRWADLKVLPVKLSTVANRLAAGASFSHAGLAGPGRPLSRSEFECLRDEFIVRGLAYWVNPTAHSQGVELSRAGVAVMRHFAEVPESLPQLPQLNESNHRVTFSPGAAHARRNTRKEVN